MTVCAKYSFIVFDYLGLIKLIVVKYILYTGMLKYMFYLNTYIASYRKVRNNSRECVTLPLRLQ